MVRCLCSVQHNWGTRSQHIYAGLQLAPKMLALRHDGKLSKMFDFVGASESTGMISRLTILLMSTLQHARRLPNTNWLAGGQTAGLRGTSVLCLVGRERLIDRVLKGCLGFENSRLDFALRSFPSNSLILSFSSRTFLLPRLIDVFTMVSTFILTRTFAISALLVGGTSQLARSHTARVLTECVPNSSASRPRCARSLVGRCPLFRMFQFQLRHTGNTEISIAAQSFDERFCRQMSCLFEVPTDTTDAPWTEAAQPTKIASDGTETVFVTGGSDTPVAETSEEGDVQDSPVRASYIYAPIDMVLIARFCS